MANIADILSLLDDEDKLDKLRTLARERKELANKIGEMQKRQSEIDDEFAKLAGATTPAPRRERVSTGTRQNGIRNDVHNAIKNAGGEISVSDIVKTLNIGDSKTAKQSVSNALSALKKSNDIKSGSSRGMWAPV